MHLCPRVPHPTEVRRLGCKCSAGFLSSSIHGKLITVSTATKVLILCFRGIFNTYGAFQTFYEQELLSSNSASAISWIGSIQGFLLLLIGSLTGPVFDMGYVRSLMIVGSVLMVFSLMMTSLAKTYYEVSLRLLCEVLAHLDVL